MHEILDEIADDITAGDLEATEYWIDKLQLWREWLRLDRFDRRAVNRRLAQYAAGDEGWTTSERVIIAGGRHEAESAGDHRVGW